MKLVPRTCRPEAGNKYYITKSKGGYSSAIEGKCSSTGRPDSACNVLANCVGYANGRFNEAANYGKIKYSLVCNAENFYAQAQKLGLKVGKEPKVGGIMVWQKGATLSGSDGAGHVEVVERKYNSKKVQTSSSGYNSSVWWLTTREYGDGNWRAGCSWMGTAYKYLGCIYNPDIEDTLSIESLKKGSTGEAVKTLQTNLNKIGNYQLVVDGSFGAATDKAVRDFQTKHKLAVDGCVGMSTQAAINDALEALKKPEGVCDLTVTIDGKAYTLWSTNIKSQNYIRIADLVNLGLATSVSWNSTKNK